MISKSRREFLILAGSGLAGIGASSQRLSTDLTQPGDSDVPRILALFSYIQGVYYFDPAGLYLEVGLTVEWVGVGRRSATAFHPSLNNHELRIPEAARPFDSKTMAQEGANFRWTFDVEGTYDYYSRTHEFLGMVGRIVVGKPGGPAENPPGYGNREGRTVMYRKPRALLEYLKSEDIVQQKRVSCPLELVEHPFPWR